MKHCLEPKSVLGRSKGGWSLFIAQSAGAALAIFGCTQNPKSEEAAAPGPSAHNTRGSEPTGHSAAHEEKPSPATNDSPEGEKKPLSAVRKELPSSFECSGYTCYKFETSREALVPLVLHHKAQLIAFGEAHTPAGFRGDSTVKRFTEDLLPTLADGSSHLLLELLNPPKEGCEKEKAAAQKESNQVTEGQAAENQNEYLALGAQARKLGVVPDILWSTCEDLAFIASPEGGVVAMMEAIARLSEKTLMEQLKSTKKGRPLVLSYGGALHNDVTPRPGRESWSYGPAMMKNTGGSYLEIDLIVPELIADSESWKTFAWYDAYQALTHRQGAILMRWGPQSYTLFLEPGR